MKHECEAMQSHKGDVKIEYDKEHQEWVFLQIWKGNEVYYGIEINYCPWCGEELE